MNKYLKYTCNKKWYIKYSLTEGTLLLANDNFTEYMFKTKSRLMALSPRKKRVNNRYYEKSLHLWQLMCTYFAFKTLSVKLFTLLTDISSQPFRAAATLTFVLKVNVTVETAIGM